MASIFYRLRAELRHGWRSLVVIAVLVGLSGGAALAGLAAARRTDTAFARMRRATDAWDLLINPNSGTDSKLRMADLRHLPGVERVGAMDGVMLYPSLVKSVPDAFNLPPILVADDDATYTVGRLLMTAGHQAATDDPDGVVVDRTFAQRQHLHIGQRFHYVVLSPLLLQHLQTVRSEAEARAVLKPRVGRHAG